MIRTSHTLALTPALSPRLIIAHIFFTEKFILCWNHKGLCILRGDA